MIKFVLFDLDGTLVDTAPDLAAAANKLRTDRALEPLSFNALRPLTGRGATTLVKAALGIAPDEASFPALRAEFLRNYEERVAVDSKPFPGITTVLEHLRDTGVRTAVVTNKQTVYAKEILRTLSLDNYFDAIIGSDTPGSAMKPAPDGIRLAMAQLDASQKETLYVGDTTSDIEASYRAGIRCLLARWDSSAAVLPVPAEAQYLAKEPSDVLSFLTL